MNHLQLMIEFLRIAAGNLWRLKLRTLLTVAGVMIGIGALVSMLSFGNGMQKNVSAEFEKFDLINTLRISPGENENVKVPIDSASVSKILSLKGVKFAFPEESFRARISNGDTTLDIMIPALPAQVNCSPYGLAFGNASNSNISAKSFQRPCR